MGKLQKIFPLRRIPPHRLREIVWTKDPTLYEAGCAVFTAFWGFWLTLGSVPGALPTTNQIPFFIGRPFWGVVLVLAGLLHLYAVLAGSAAGRVRFALLSASCWFAVLAQALLSYPASTATATAIAGSAGHALLFLRLYLLPEKDLVGYWGRSSGQ